jgi:hypothetical protein
MRQIRVTAIYNGVEYPRFRGFIRSLNYDPRRREAALHCEDLLMWLGRVSPVVGPLTEMTTGQIIREILEASEWNLPDLIDVAEGDGDVVAEFSMGGTDAARTALGGIADLLESEQGQFYAARDGAATYRGRHHRVSEPSSLSITDKFRTTTRPGVSMDTITNIARVAKGDVANAQEARDEASIAVFGPSSKEIVSDYFADDAQALALAQYIVFRASSPTTPIWAVPMFANADEALLDGVQSTEIGDRITLADNRASLAGDFYIESMEETVRPPAFHDVNWSLSMRAERDEEVFVLSESLLGSGDILAHY